MEKNKWHPTGSWPRFSPFFPPSPQFTTSLRIWTTFSPQPPTRFPSRTHSAQPPNLCLGPLTLQRRASDGQIFQQTFSFRLLKNWAFFRIPPRTLLWAQVPFSEDFEPSTFHVKNWNFAHECDGHTTQHQRTWKLILMALVTLLKISSWILPSSYPSPVLFQTLTERKKPLPRFLFIFATFRLLLYNLIVRVSSNHAFPCNIPSQEVRSAGVSMNSTDRNNDSKLREFVDLSRHLHSPTRRVKFWPIKIFSRWQLGLVHIFENRTGRRPGVKDKQEKKKFATHDFRKLKIEQEIGMGNKSSQSRIYKFHRWSCTNVTTCAFRKLEARDS